MTMPINLDGEKPDNVSQEQWDRLKNVFDDIYADESEEQITPDKLTDSEIVKALECCVNEKTCKNCAYYGRPCMTPLKRDTLDLINRLQAENKHYSHNVKEMTDSIRNYQKALEQAKAENEKSKNNCDKCAGKTRNCIESLQNIIAEQKAENERLKKGWKADAIRWIIADAKAEAYKEVFEKLKDKSIVCKVKLYGKGKFFPCLSAVTLHDIKLLEKELVGEDNAEEKE